MKIKFRKIYISFLISFCLFLLIIFWIIFPLLREIKEASLQFSLNRQKMDSLVRQETSLQKFRAISQEVSNNLLKANSLFFDAEVPVDFIEFLEKTASTSNVSIEISSVSWEKKNQGYPWPSLIFSLRVSGNFSDFVEFIERIKNSSYLSEIENISIKKTIEEISKSETSSVGISSTLSLRVFTKEVPELKYENKK